jgi:hypothetical protein
VGGTYTAYIHKNTCDFASLLSSFKNKENRLKMKNVIRNTEGK